MRREDNAVAILAATRSRSLYAFALTLTCDSEEAADLVQEAFARVLARKASSDIEKLEPYLKTTIANVYLDGKRRAQKWSSILPTIRAGIRDSHQEATDGFTSIEAALGRLSPMQRTCVIMYYLDDRAVGQIANALHCSEGNVKRHLSDGRARIKQSLEKE